MKRRDKALARSGFLLVVNHPERTVVELRSRHAVEFVRPESAQVIAMGFAGDTPGAATTVPDGGDDAG